MKRTFSRAAGLSLHCLVGFPTHDATNNFRMYDAALVKELGLESRQGFEVALELTAKAFRRGVPIAEVPTTWRDRTQGTIEITSDKTAARLSAVVCLRPWFIILSEIAPYLRP